MDFVVSFPFYSKTNDNPILRYYFQFFFYILLDKMRAIHGILPTTEKFLDIWHELIAGKKMKIFFFKCTRKN